MVEVEERGRPEPGRKVKPFRLAIRPRRVDAVRDDEVKATDERA